MRRSRWNIRVGQSYDPGSWYRVAPFGVNLEKVANPASTDPNVLHSLKIGIGI